MDAVFTDVYARGVWGVGSGGGSTPEHCAPLRDFLIDYLRSAGAASLVDLGCGDMQWMPAVVRATGVSYTGVDCVAPLLERHRATYGAEPAFSFVHADVAGAPPGTLPTGDVYFTKDVLQHWPTETIEAWLRAFFDARPDAHLLVANCSHDAQPARPRIVAGEAAALRGEYAPLSYFRPEALLRWQTKTLYRLHPPRGA
jgi:hypothetical protein